MSTDRRFRFAATTALAVSCFALGFSVWAVGSHGHDPAASARRDAPALTTAAAVKSPERAAAPKVTPASADVHSDIAPAPQKPADPAPPPSTTHESDPTAAGLEVKRLVVTRGVQHREPLDTEQLTAGAGPVFAFVELRNSSDNAKTITVDFQHGTDAPVGHIKLKVPAHSSRWRTWGRTRMVDQAGEWTALVRAADGTELAHTAFSVVAPQS